MCETVNSLGTLSSSNSDIQYIIVLKIFLGANNRSRFCLVLSTTVVSVLGISRETGQEDMCTHTHTIHIHIRIHTYFVCG